LMLSYRFQDDKSWEVGNRMLREVLVFVTLGCLLMTCISEVAKFLGCGPES